MRSLLALVIRIPIYLFFFWLAFFVLMPRINPEILGLLLTMPLASLAIFLDIFLTAKIKGKKTEEVIAQRIILVDNLLAPEGERLSDRRHLGTRDVEALPEERDLLEERTGSHYSDK